jgi:hypothetical protein
MKAMGFNGARIHQKIESPYFHYLCDRLGVLTTYEMPSFYWPTKRAFASYENELREVIRRDAMHPSCIAWVLFNETWGIWGVYGKRSGTRRFVERMLALVREADPTRLVIDNSGWEHVDTDIVDFHHYLNTAELARDLYRKMRKRDPETLRGFSLAGMLAFHLPGRVGTMTRSIFLDREAENRAQASGAPWFLSEYGGFGWYDSGDGGLVEDRIERYTRDIVATGLFCGYCLTQLYDVGGETNGLLDFERNPKVDFSWMRAINAIGEPARFPTPDGGDSAGGRLDLEASPPLVYDDPA